MLDEQPNANRYTFRFRTSNGQLLTEKIADIEALANERLRVGISFHSVQNGALSLLKIALDRISGELVESAKGRQNEKGQKESPTASE